MCACVVSRAFTCRAKVCLWGSESKASSWNHLSPVFMWVLGIEFRPLGSCSHVTSPKSISNHPKHETMRGLPVEVGYLFPSCGSQDWVLVVRLQGQRPYLLSHLRSSKICSDADSKVGIGSIFPDCTLSYLRLLLNNPSC